MKETIHQQQTAYGKEYPADRNKIKINIFSEIIKQRVGRLIENKE